MRSAAVTRGDQRSKHTTGAMAKLRKYYTPELEELVGTSPMPRAVSNPVQKAFRHALHTERSLSGISDVCRC